VTTGVILIILLTFIAALVSRQVVTPVRAAREAAENLASGNLHDRMQVRGTDDLARLATSMNYMASELEKQITTLEQLSAVQQRFVSDVSHELRTPLTTVRMAAEVLHDSREDFDPIAARSAELLQAELDRFEALLTDLLEISRFDAGAIRLHLEDLLVAEFVRQAVAVSSLPRTKVTVSDRAEGLILHGDRRRLARVVANLIDNARVHGGGAPEIMVTEAEGEGEPLAHVWIVVEDHGPGVPNEERSLVFERFARGAVAGRRSSSDGAGLGLSLVDEHVRMHGGRVWVEDRDDGKPGARFVLELPAEEVGVG
jgi:two-component system sensor histidine kinase MtrB